MLPVLPVLLVLSVLSVLLALPVLPVLEEESDSRFEVEVEVAEAVVRDPVEVKEVELVALELENKRFDLVDGGEDCKVLDVVRDVDFALVNAVDVGVSLVGEVGAGDALMVLSGT